LEITRRVDQASRQTTEVQNAFAEACRLVDELRAAGNQIGEVALSISQLTSQVNLLALNATIEAARAGEAGRGFAVVAGEVKALAQRTADANAHITERVAAVRAATLACSQALARATDGVQSMAEDQQGIAAAVEEQSASTEEIRVHADAAAQLSQAIVTSVAGVTGAAGRAEKAVKKTDAAASELNGVASALRSTFAPAST
jgi:methyl-accepting chemotaxis protein